MCAGRLITIPCGRPCRLFYVLLSLFGFNQKPTDAVDDLLRLFVLAPPVLLLMQVDNTDDEGAPLGLPEDFAANNERPTLV